MNTIANDGILVFAILKILKIVSFSYVVPLIIDSFLAFPFIPNSLGAYQVDQ